VSPVPEVSVLMPCFNTPGRYLLEAAASVLGQGTGVELVLQDGRSTRPDTVAALEQLAGQDRVRLAVECDSGQSDALNRALARARSEIIGWLNADDLYFPGALSGHVRRLGQDRSLAGSFGDWQLWGHDDQVLRHYTSSPWSYRRLYWQGCYIFSGALLLRRSALAAIGGFDPQLHFCMDYDAFLRLGPAARVDYLPGDVAAFRVHPESKTGSAGYGFARESLTVRRRFASSPVEHVAAWVLPVRTAVFVLSQPVRHSSWYSRWRKGKRL
jgi:glycosyltransferase involved in cell wall biosynthesis